MDLLNFKENLNQSIYHGKPWSRREQGDIAGVMTSKIQINNFKNGNSAKPLKTAVAKLNVKSEGF